jgi:DNA-binding CsgD family transcriptional regulator
MIKNRVEMVGRETLRLRGSRSVLRQADATAARAPAGWADRGGTDALSDGDRRGADWGVTPNLAECLVPALRVLSLQVERLEEELNLVRRERDAERARVTTLVRTLEEAKSAGQAAKAPAPAEPADAPKADGELAAAFPRLSTRQKQVLDMIAQGKSTKDIARELNLGIGTVKVHMSALYSALGVSSRSAALAASYHHLSRLGQAHGAVAAAAA